MQGLNASRILAAGLVIAVIGGIFFGVAHARETDPWVLMTGYGLMGLGGLLFAGGFFLMIYALRDPAGVHEQDAAASFTALARCMVAMSIVDGDLDDREIHTIRNIYETLTGERLDKDFVIGIAENMHADGSDIEDELSSVRPILTNDLKEKIIKASFYILAADGVVEENEAKLMDNIRKGLDYPFVKYKLMKKEFFEKNKHRLEGI